MCIQLSPPICVVKIPLPRQKGGITENALDALCTLFYIFGPNHFGPVLYN